ncbi:MAG: 3'(2'),5'-bisphosphate nucleotidase CysQ [Deltaproteobacteria bacterium]|nr:3'(2'),5'-bisphosphate nucleotidase CysQ [Deltaproteobacteria bacterium]
MGAPRIEEVLAIADEAARVIMAHYARPSVRAEDKLDGSPVTDADHDANALLTRELTRRWPHPLVSEESPLPPYEVRQQWPRFWLIDPLDGTRDFIAKTGEFGVNVALIEGGRPVLGVIVAPALGVAWMAARGLGAHKREAGALRAIDCRHRRGPFIGLKSRFYSTAAVDAYLAAQEVDEVKVIGSTIKIGLIAEGAADVYMSPGHSKEWDTAPGQVIVEEAGGSLVVLETGQALTYGRADPENPALVVRSARLTPTA